jgi:nitroreductase
VDRDRAVPIDLVERLCAAAQWAPNHKRTWPWRFAYVEGHARQRIGDVMADVLAARGVDAERVLKTRGKYLRTPGLLVVGTAPGDNDERTAENRDAVAAGVQTLLLGATAAGLASYWGSCPAPAQDAVATFCGFANGTHVTAMIYLGWPAGTVAVPERPPVHVTRLT